MSIGIFDSGIGGLTVLKEVRKILPEEEIFYFGDTARVPYGVKTKDLIVEYSMQITDFLLKKDIKALVIACNTATALALDELKSKYDIPVIGVIDAGVRTAISMTKNKNIGVIGTKATINSKKYKEKIEKESKEINVYQKACSLFVPMVEEGLVEGKVAEKIVKMYLDDFTQDIDTLILGCTHYPLLKNTIEKLYPDLYIADPAIETARDLKQILQEKNLLENKKSYVKYFVSDGIENFRAVGNMFLDEEIENIELVKMH